MGWFGGSSTKDKDEGAPNREDRKKCWEARDGYFLCLDNAGVVKAGDEGKACAKESKEYEKNCARSWVRRSFSPVLFG